MTTDPVQTTVNRILEAVGGGRVLCLGPQPESLVATFRSKAVDATGQAYVPDPAAATLPWPDASFDLVYVDASSDAGAPPWPDHLVHDVRRLARRAVCVRVAAEHRDATERAWIQSGWRKHPLGQIVTPYGTIDGQSNGQDLLFEALPAGADDDGLAALLETRELHMDMLREPGRRSDAHIARYTFAREFIRPGDRVVDAACGYGYGSAVLADGTRAESVFGIDLDPATIRYATKHYGRQRSRLTFAAMDVLRLADLGPGSVDAIVTFETIEHVPDPDAFLEVCHHILTPAGRVIGSVPNLWLDDSGRDPNPHHLQVFDRSAFEALYRRHFFIEHTHGQTAGGGMKLPDATRQIWPAADDGPDAEWWLLVGMKDPVADAGLPVRDRLAAPHDGTTSNIYEYDRDYERPWLARAMVTIGLRTTSPSLLEEFARGTLAGCRTDSADRGAGLCVLAYRHLERGEPFPEDIVEQIASYTRTTSSVPHVIRWQTSLRYVSALAAIQEGRQSDAVEWFEACAATDALAFSPHLATKTVGAAFLRGWMAVQDGHLDVARRWWSRGVEEAERVLRRPWDEWMLDREAPAPFGLHEAAIVVDLASQCAKGLSLLDDATERHGIVATEVFQCLQPKILPLLAGAASRVRASATPASESPALDVTHVRDVVIFGASEGGRRATTLAQRCGWQVKYVVDNNQHTWGQEAHGVIVREPSALEARDFDLVIVASFGGRTSIDRQLADMGLSYGADYAYFLDTFVTDGVRTQLVT